MSLSEGEGYMVQQEFIIAAIAIGLISVGIAIYLYFWVMRQDAGSAKAQKIAGWIRQGSRSYLLKLY